MHCLDADEVGLVSNDPLPATGSVQVVFLVIEGINLDTSMQNASHFLLSIRLLSERGIKTILSTDGHPQSRTQVAITIHFWQFRLPRSPIFFWFRAWVVCVKLI